jgi:ankyrin repeat protein
LIYFFRGVTKKEKPTTRRASVADTGGSSTEQVDAEALKALNVFNYYGYAPIHAATYHGRLKALKFLLDCCVSPNQQSRAKNWTFPTHLAVLANRRSILKHLLKKGADPYLKNWDGMLGMWRLVADGSAVCRS